MAERERRRTDAYAVGVGILRAVVVTVPIFGVVYGFRALAEPVLRDFFRSASLPGWQPILAVSALVGGAVGWSAMRGARRYVAATGDDFPDALERVRRDLDAAARGGSRTAVVGEVRVWSPDLLYSWSPDASPDGPGVNDG